MKIYQIQYTNNFICIKRELKDVGEELYNLDIPYYLTIEYNIDNYLIIKMYHTDDTQVETLMIYDNQNLVSDIKRLIRYYI